MIRDDERDQLEFLRRIQREYFQPEQLAKYGAFGTAIGHRVRQHDGGRRDEAELCLRVFVRPGAKATASFDARLQRLQRFSVDGQDREVPIDVCEMKPPRRHGLSYSAPIYPDPTVVKGAMGGTLAGWAWDCTDESMVMLSAAHILGHAGSHPIVQDKVEIGTFKRGVLSPDLDAAIADPHSASAFNPALNGIGIVIFSWDDVLSQTRVCKFGTNTGLTEGTVDAVNYSFDDGDLHVRNAFSVLPAGPGSNWSDAGDSGALVCARIEEPNGVALALGLHWGDHADAMTDWQTVGIAYPILDVQQQLELETLAVRPFAAFLEALIQGQPDYRFIARERSPADAAVHHPNIGAALLTQLASAPAWHDCADRFREQRVLFLRALAAGEQVRTVLAQALAPLLSGKQSVEAVLDHRITPGEVLALLGAIDAIEGCLELDASLRPLRAALEASDTPSVRELLALHPPVEPPPPVPAPPPKPRPKPPPKRPLKPKK